MIGQSPDGPRPSLLAVCRWPSRGDTSKQSRPMRTSLQPHICVGGGFHRTGSMPSAKLGFLHETPLCPSPNRKEPQQPLSASCPCHQALRSHPSPVTCFRPASCFPMAELNCRWEGDTVRRLSWLSPACPVLPSHPRCAVCMEDSCSWFPSVTKEATLDS